MQDPGYFPPLHSQAKRQVPPRNTGPHQRTFPCYNECVRARTSSRDHAHRTGERAGPNDRRQSNHREARSPVRHFADLVGVGARRRAAAVYSASDSFARFCRNSVYASRKRASGQGWSVARVRRNSFSASLNCPRATNCLALSRTQPGCPSPALAVCGKILGNTHKTRNHQQENDLPPTAPDGPGFTEPQCRISFTAHNLRSLTMLEEPVKPVSEWALSPLAISNHEMPKA